MKVYKNLINKSYIVVGPNDKTDICYEIDKEGLVVASSDILKTPLVPEISGVWCNEGKIKINVINTSNNTYILHKNSSIFNLIN